MTDFSGSSPSSPNTKPEPLQGQRCSSPNSGLSVSSCASDPLPMPHSRQRYAKYVVKSSKIHWNSRKRNLNAFYRMLSYFRSYSHIMWSPMKWHEQAQIHSDLHDGTSVSPFHLRLALSGSILPYLPLMTDSSASSPSSPNTKPEPLQGQCCCATKSGLSGPSCASDPLPMPDSRQRCGKYVVKSSKIHWNSHKRNLNAFYHMLSYFRSYSHIMWSPMKWNEQAQIHSDLHDGLGTSQHQSWNLPFTHVTISPSTSSVWIHIALPPLMTDFSASSPSSPNTKPEPRHHQCCCNAKPGLSGSSSASVLLPMPASRQRSAKYIVKSSKIHWNSHKRNLSAFYRILFILPLILTYHVVCNEMKWTSSNSLRSAWWTWHISAPIV